MLAAVVATVAPGEVWVADRNFCVSGFLHAIEHRQAFFIIRQHGGLTTNPLAAMPGMDHKERKAAKKMWLPATSME